MKHSNLQPKSNVECVPPFDPYTPARREIWLVVSRESGGVLFLFPTERQAREFEHNDRVVGPYVLGPRWSDAEARGMARRWLDQRFSLDDAGEVLATEFDVDVESDLVTLLTESCA